MKEEERDKITDRSNSYARFGALGLQMVAMLVLFVIGGRWLDGRLQLHTPWFTVLGVFIGIIGALWFLFHEVRRKG